MLADLVFHRLNRSIWERIRAEASRLDHILDHLELLHYRSSFQLRLSARGIKVANLDRLSPLKGEALLVAALNQATSPFIGDLAGKGNLHGACPGDVLDRLLRGIGAVAGLKLAASLLLRHVEQMSSA